MKDNLLGFASILILIGVGSLFQRAYDVESFNKELNKKVEIEYTEQTKRLVFEACRYGSLNTIQIYNDIKKLHLGMIDYFVCFGVNK